MITTDASTWWHPSAKLPSFRDVRELLARKMTDTPVFCYYPQRFRSNARRFIEGFPGEVLYAVKANPDPDVMRWIVEGGIRAFDTASIPEIALARRTLRDAHCAFNHPVKARSAIRDAYRLWGVREFVVDHGAELVKLVEEAGCDIIVQVRIAIPNPFATISFSSKFGATAEEGAKLLRTVAERGAVPAISTHLGYQTTDPRAFADGLRVLSRIVAAAGIRPAYVNIGGGFPSVLMPENRQLEDFFRAIASTHRTEPPIADVRLKCEPGSALTHSGGSVLTQVLLVKDHALYLNDGVYGALAELLQSKIQPPTRVFTAEGDERAGAMRSFKVFGATCDSYDTIPAPFALPTTICEGDWLHLEMMGAYSSGLITDFNGLGAHEFAVINE